MALPDVLNKFTHREPPTQEFFWALEIWEGGLKSALWTVEDGKTKVAALGSDEPWNEKDETLVQAADRSLASAAEEYFQEKTESQPSKVIFGLPDDWLEDNKITHDWQQKLQTVCEQLELQAVGFVLTVDAINHQLRAIEGMPPSAILISPQKEQITVVVLNQGKVESVEQVVRSDNLAADVYEGLSRSANKELPSRMLLFNGGKDEEKFHQTLLEFAWQPALPFLHFPKIDVLPTDFDISAVCLAGGGEVARSLGLEVTGAIVTTEAIAENEEAVETSQNEQQSQAELPPVGPENEAADFGFVNNQDVGEADEVKEEEKEEVPAAPEPETAEEELRPVRTDNEKSDLAVVEKPSRRLPAFLAGRPGLSFSRPRLTVPGKPFRWLALIGLIALLVGGGAVFFWFFSKAEVVLTVAPKNLEKDFELRIDPNQEVVDEQGLTLPGRVFEKELEDELTEATTGKKTVGEKAKGEVTIFNTGVTRHLSAGALLTGPGGLKFSLDQEMTIGSGSAVTREEVKAGVTAADIGTEYNIAGDSTFSLANLDSSLIGAKSTAAFTGGTSRQIQVVSDEDQKRMVNKLTEELKNRLKSETLADIADGVKIVDSTFTAKETGRNFNHKVNDEATELNLKLKLKGSLLSFAEDDFILLTQRQMAGSVPEGYQVTKEQIQSRFEFKKAEKDGSVLYKVFVSAKLLPRINPDEVTQNIKGKYPRLAREYLATLPGFVDVDINIRPKLPEAFATLPRQAKNISLDIKGQ